jgi:hypothetical protein
LSHSRLLVTTLVLGLYAVAGCTSAAAPGGTETTASAPAVSTSTVPPSSTATTIAATTTSVAVDPTVADTPQGRCATLVPGSIGFRNTTGRVADEYRVIGESTLGRTIWSEHWGSRTGPQVLVLGQVHGDECTPAWMVQAIREQPPVDFGIWLVPTVNPDGLAAHTRHTALDVDPNRDGFDLVTPEARAVMHVTDLVQPVLTIHLHSPYRWIGAHNGTLATEVARAMSAAAGWGSPFNAGRVKNGTQAFLWEGQERVIPGHQSVLVEFPAISPLEAPDAPKPAERQTATIAEVRAAAVHMRDALYEVFAATPPAPPST